MKKFLLSLMCAFVAFAANAATVVDLYKDFTTAQSLDWASEAANARISFSATDGLVYSSTKATANNWDAQYWIANGNTFMPENTYKVTMLIKGSDAGTIGNLKLGDWNQGVDNYGKFQIPADEYKEVSIEVSGVTGGNGIMLQTGSYEGEFSIKWVKITHEDNRDASKFCLALTDIPAGTNAWDHQLQYPFSPALPAGDYTLSLDVKGDEAGSMSIWGDYVEGANYGPGFDFGTSWETKTVDFNLTKDYKQFALVFGQYTGTSIWFDNIKITSKATGEDVLSADFASGTLEGFNVSGFWTNDGGWVLHTATSAIVEAPEDDPEPEPVPYTIATTAGKIGTVVLDYPASVEGATLYSVASFSASGLVLEEVGTNMEAGTPYIYQASGNEVVCTKKGVSISHGDFTDENVGNGLRGMFVELTPSTGRYDQIRTNGYIITGNKLRNIAQGNVTIPANRCFFDSDKCTNKDDSSAKMIVIPAEENTTAIKNVNASLENGKIYDTNGREVKSMQKGNVYIMGGMKVYVK